MPNQQAPGHRAPQNVLVTGATGFVGGWLARCLAAEGVRTRVLSRGRAPLDPEITAAFAAAGPANGAGLDVRLGDVGDPASLRAACEGVDVVLHLAGLIAHSGAEREAMRLANVEGTRHVVEACATQGVRRLVNLSSVAAVGSTFDGRLLKEDDANPTAFLHLAYGETKRDAEAIALAAARAGRFECVSLCPGTIYGPGDARKGSRGSMLKVARGQLPFYTSGGVNVVDVEAVCDALWAAACGRGRSGERYLIGGENVRLRDLFRLIAEESGAKPPWIRLPNFAVRALGKIGDAREAKGAHPSLTTENAWNAILFHWFDSSKARAEFGLRPKSAREAIAASVGWSRDHGLI